MKGLIYKELILGKKNFIALLAVAIGVVSLGILVGLGTRFGNLKDFAVEDKARFFNIFVYATYSLVLAFVVEIFVCIERDKASGWREIEYTMPISAKERVGSWYLICAIMLAGCLLLGVTNVGVIALVFGQAITGSILKNMVCILLGVMVVPLVGIPIYQRFTAKSVERFWNVVVTVGILALGIVMMIILIKSKDEEAVNAVLDNIVEKVGDFFNGFCYLSPVIMPLLMVGSFTLSVRWYQRRKQ